MGYVDSLAARRAPLLGALVAAAAILTLLLGAQQAHAAACTTSWQEGVSGNWNEPLNWTAGVPDANDVACIQTTSNAFVAIQAQTGNTANATAVAKELHLGGPSGTQSLFLSSENVGGTDYDASLTLVGGAGSASDVGANGKIQIQRATGGNAGICAGSPLTNNGTIETLGGLAPARTLGGNIVNAAGGTLKIDIDTAVPSTQTCGANVLENAGTVAIAASRTLTVGGTYKQTGGTTGPGKLVVNGGHLAPSGGTGTLTVQGMGLLDSDVAAGVTVNVQGTPAANASLGNGNTGARTNNGTINLTSSDSSNGAILDLNPGGIVNKGTLAVLGGAGGIRDLGGSIDNQGTFSVGFVNTTNDLTNVLLLNTSSGSVTVDFGGTLEAPTFNQSGGTVTVNGKLGKASGTVAISGGTFKGAGKVESDVSNSGGTVEPGDTEVGFLTFHGDYSQGSGGALAVRVEGPNPGTDFDQLYVSGTATLAGTLNVTTVGTQGGEFPIVQAGQVNGSFSTKNFTGQTYGVRTNATSFTLVAKPLNTAPPFVTGAPRVGNSLLCNIGTWTSPDPDTTFAFRWLRDGAPTAATTPSRKVLFADQGHNLSCVVTVTNSAGASSAPSNALTVPKQLAVPGTFPKKTLRATKTGNVVVPVVNPNLIGVGGNLILRNAKGKVVGSAKFTIAKASKKPVKVHLKSGAFANLVAKGQLKYGATLVLSKGAVKKTSKTTLTVNKPKP